MTVCLLGVVGVGLIVWGLISIFAQDMAWGFQEWSNKAKGVVSQRTGSWEVMTLINGIVLIILGIIVLAAALIQS